jgi:hypothetical protein
MGIRLGLRLGLRLGNGLVRYNPWQDEDIVYAIGNNGNKYDVGSSHPGGGEAPKGLAVRQ